MLGIDGTGIFVLHQRLHDSEHVVHSRVDEDLLIFFVGLHYLDITEVNMVNLLPAGKPVGGGNGIGTHLTGNPAVEGDAVRRAVDDSDEMLPAIDRSHDLLRSATDRSRRIVRVESHADAGFFGDRDHGLQEIGHVLPHFLEIMRPLTGKRGQIFEFDFPRVGKRGERRLGDLSRLVPIDGTQNLSGLGIDQKVEFIIEPGVTRPRASDGFVIALDRPMCVEVVFDDRQTRFPGGFDRSDVRLQVLSATRFPVPHAFRRVEHGVVCDATVVFGSLNRARDAFHRPRPASSAGRHTDQVVDAQLPDPFIGIRAGSHAAPSVCGFGGSNRDRRFLLEISPVAPATAARASASRIGRSRILRRGT